MSLRADSHGPGRRSLSPDELADLEELFDEIDEDGDERLQFAEFSQLLDDLGVEMQSEELRGGSARSTRTAMERSTSRSSSTGGASDKARGMPRTTRDIPRSSISR